MSLLLLGSLIIATGKCGNCGLVRAAFVNLNGKTCCAVCAAKGAA